MGRDQDKSAPSKSALSRSIAEILGTGEPAVSGPQRPGPLRKSLIYGSMALLAVNPAPVSAVGLGEMHVNSRLGEPLDATVPVSLAAGESLPQNCVAPTRGNGGIGAPRNLQISSPAARQPGTYNLRVTTPNALHEPMYEISLLIDCPGTPVLLRQYVLMLDLPGVDATMQTSTVSVSDRGDTVSVPTVATQQSLQTAGRSTTPITSARAVSSVQRSRAPIPAGQPYRVSAGDTLSTIAARIDGRAPDTTWSVANLIFAANPQAFIRNNPDLIKLGSLITIPDAAALGGAETGRPAMHSVAATPPSNTRPESVNEPRPMPAPTPAPVAASVATSRPEVFVTEPDRPVPTTVSSEPDIDNAVFAQAPQTLDAEDVAPSGDAEVITPFLDELPAAAAADDTVERVVETDLDTTPVVMDTSPSLSESSESVNPLVAIIVGMLLGLLVSLLMLRRQLIDAVMGLVRHRRPAGTGHIQSYAPLSTRDDEETNPNISDLSSPFDTSVADSAFDTQQEEVEPLPIVGEAESTYIVETSDPEPTAQVEVPVIDPGTVEDEGASSTNPDDEMLAQLFADDDSILGGSDNNTFDPTGGADIEATGTFAGPTAHMPQSADDQMFDPTAELPADVDGEIFDPTAEMPSGESDALLDDTVETPFAEDESVDSPLMTEFDSTLEGELDALPSGDEDGLSQTLQEALSLLESDFEDEFTASQILERSEINRSLDKAAAADEAKNAGPAKRKVRG